MDFNLNADVKGINLPPAPTNVEVEDRARPPVAPVEESGASEQSKLDEKALHNREGASGEKGSSALSKEEVVEYVQEIQERLETMNSRLRFGFMKDDKLESYVFTITDMDTGEMIGQVPSEEIMELRSKLKDLIGLMFDKKA